MNKKRIMWLDQARAVGMFLVLLGHAISDKTNLRKYIYTFHMPFFFILSGMTFKTTDEIKIKEFLISRVKRLIVPYFILNIIMLSVFYINVSIGAKDPKTIFELIIGTLYSNPKEYGMIAGATWFITCLFLTELLFYLLKRYFKEDKQLTLAILIMGVLGFANSIAVGKKVPAPWHLSTVFTAVVFYFIGYLIMKHLDKIVEFIKNWKNYIITILGLIITGMYFAKMNGLPSMNAEIYGSPIYFYIAAITTSLAIILIMMKVPYIKPLNYIGQNTIIYLAVHEPLIWMFQKLVPWFDQRILTNLLLCILLYIALMPISYIITKLIPMAAGKYKYKKKIEI